MNEEMRDGGVNGRNNGRDDSARVEKERGRLNQT